MPDNSLQQQLVKYLADAHSIEEQALQQLRGAPDAARDPEIAEIFRQHLVETEGHERTVRGRLEAHGERSSSLKDLLMRVGGAGFLLFARSQPDTPGKLVAHAYSYEHLEFASYELLIRVAERAADTETVEAARRIRDEERAMAERLATSFDKAVEASLAEKTPDDLDAQLDKYLQDAHAIEAQAIKLLENARAASRTRTCDDLPRASAGDPQPAATRRREIAGARRRLFRLERHGDACWRPELGDLLRDTSRYPGQAAGFAYAFEHLEIAAYEELKRVAQKAGDTETVRIAERIIAEEQAAANSIAANWDAAVDALLSAVGAVA